MASRTGLDFYTLSSGHRAVQHREGPEYIDPTKHLIHKYENYPRKDISSYLDDKTYFLDMTVFDQCVYYFSAVSAAMFLIWIGWMPLLHFMVQPHTKGSPTTTISETFGNFNVLATIYITGPLSVLFLLRVYTTLGCAFLLGKAQTKKFVCILLLLSQYSLFIVIRFDAIQGYSHVVATVTTFCLLLTYHIYTHDPNYVNGGKICGYPSKMIFGTASVVCIGTFAFLMYWVDNQYERYKDLWTFATVLEVLAVLFLGAMDMVDIYNLGSRIDNNYHAEEVPNI